MIHCEFFGIAGMY